jgi:predicted nuclease of restriction endonuclease-like (RecB) superfamily
MTKLASHDALLKRIRFIWESARSYSARSVNTGHVVANWLIGQQIFEEEQKGAKRAVYGAELLKLLSLRLTQDFGSGFSISALKYMRVFYLAYPDLFLKGHALRDFSMAATSISHALRDQLTFGSEVDSDWQPGQLNSALGWTHYRALMKETRREVRNFYEIEAVRSAWGARQLERQMHTLLFERLAKSRDKKGVLALANDGQTINTPIDAIKEPYVLEFLGLPESHRLVESRIEEALISQLQGFLLELGNGFAFIGRQQRLTLDGDHFYPDLVFYHVKLKCYVVIDLKVGKLTHADLGQMLLYVNYYDIEVRLKGDNPTIGLVLCTEKNDAAVRYVLAEKHQQIFARRYQFELPTEATLRAEMQRELEHLSELPKKPKVAPRKSSAKVKLMATAAAVATLKGKKVKQ